MDISGKLGFYHLGGYSAYIYIYKETRYTTVSLGSKNYSSWLASPCGPRRVNFFVESLCYAHLLVNIQYLDN